MSQIKSLLIRIFKSPSNKLKSSLKSEKRADVYANFTINYLRLDQLYTFDIFPPYQCNTNCFFLAHQNTIDNSSIRKIYPTIRQLEKQEIKSTPDYKTLLTWAKKKGVTLRNAIPIDKTKYYLL